MKINGKAPQQKICDIVWPIPAQTHFWNVEQHEPLLVGVCFFFIHTQALEDPRHSTHGLSGRQVVIAVDG